MRPAPTLPVSPQRGAVKMGTSVHNVKSGSRRTATPSRARFRSPIDKAKAYEVIWQQVAPLFEATRSVENAAFVYFIGEQDDGPIKIGHSKDPIGRLRTMQTGNSRRLRIEHVLAGDPHLEKLLHEIWRDHAVVSARQTGKVDAPPGTEWFDPAIRAELAPIIRTAAANQVKILTAGDPNIHFKDLERAVREAHATHDFVIRGRDIPLLLGQNVGYVRPRTSRI